MLIHATAVTPQTAPPDAMEYGQFVKVAYDVYDAGTGNLNPSLKDYPTLPSGYVPLLNIQMVDFFGTHKTTKYYGFFAASTTVPETIIMAIRGTQSIEEWWDDFQWKLIPFPYASDAGNVASGFLDIYEGMTVTVPDSAAPAISLKDLANDMSASGGATLPDGGRLEAGTSLVVVGHSLGSALATLFAAHVAAADNVEPLVYTLASPRVGDGAFATFYNAKVNTNHRIYNWPDIVPAFPKDPLDNYVHVKGGYEVDSLYHPLKVKISVLCFHSILTYLFLLGAPESILGGHSGCGV